MEGIVFLVIVVPVAAFCYKYRDPIRDWLNNVNVAPSDPKLAELKENEMAAHQAVADYKETLRIKTKIADYQERLKEIEKFDGPLPGESRTEYLERIKLE